MKIDHEEKHGYENPLEKDYGWRAIVWLLLVGLVIKGIEYLTE